MSHSETTPDDPPESIRTEGTGTRFTGTEPIFGGFTNTATIISNLRLTHDGQIYVSVLDVGAAITTLAREYRFHGDAVRAYQQIVRLRSNFETRVQQWKSEEGIRLQKKKSMNGNQLRDLEKELNRVHLEIARGESTLNKLQNDLDLISRVGDDCPLLKPQQNKSPASDEYQVPVLKKKRKPNQALLSLAKLVQPNGLTLSFQQARFQDDFDDAIREHVYDQKTHVSIIVHWSDRNPVTRERGELYLRMLLIPKHVEAVEQLDAVLQHYAFRISAGTWATNVTFERIDLSHEKTIVDKRITQYLHDIKATRFEHKDVLVKRPFELFAADICTAMPFSEGSTCPFKLTIKKKQPKQ